MFTPADVAWALCIGADFVCSARGFMFMLGYIKALKCDKNTRRPASPPRLQKGIYPPTKASRVAAYAENITREVGLIVHASGVRSPRELRRFHVQIVQPHQRTLALDALHPPPESIAGPPRGRCGA
ncbi:glutamate synthase-related protein [Thiorhodococcus mannitoliphagus]|uniref:glutamate synthase-related protein n=1 Tax=Thiorhodococcus mannitoliphagus TaxID=329406 RepID=UPI0013DF019A|nr:glutamate synthase-related protein [Thiorhodococcus mannitoliphagus]